jgi:hypothetical protein
MGYADAYAQGVSSGSELGNSVLLDPIKRQSAIEQLQAQRQENAMNALNMQKQQMTYQDMLGARGAAANAQPTPAQTTTSITPSAATPPPDAATALNAPVIPSAVADMTKTPDAASLNPQPEASPTVQAYNEGRVETKTTPAQAPNRMKAQLDYYNSVGNTDAANNIHKQILDQSKQITDSTGNPNEGLKVINDALGTSYTYLKMANMEFLKDGEGNIIGVTNPNGVNMDVTSGMPLSDALSKNSVPIDGLGGGKSQIVEGWLAKNKDLPLKDQVSGLWDLAEKNKISLKTINPAIQVLIKAASERDANERQIKSQEFAQEQQGRQFSQAISQQARMMANQNAISDKRMATLMQMRLTPALDSQNGNAPTLVTPEMASANPGRYLPAGAGATALTKSGVFNEIRNAANNLKQSANNLKGDFSVEQRVQFANALKSRDPHSAVSALIGGTWGKALSQDQIEYVTDVNQMVESAMAMRTVLGTGQGSDLAREAMTSTVPGLASPSKAMINTQLKKLDSQLNALEPYIPKVTPRQSTPQVAKGVNTANPVHNGKTQGYKQADGSIVDATGKRLN